MQKRNPLFKKIISTCVAAAMMISTMTSATFAAGHENLEAGAYTVNAELSCYVSAMGGVEFGADLLEKTTVTVNADGSADVSLSLTKGDLTIYGVNCTTFVDSSKGIKYYNGSEWVNATYKLSNGTATNPDGTEVNYVDNITFTLPYTNDSYDLSILINSQVMGTHFGGPDSNYSATLTIDWTSASKVGIGHENLSVGKYSINSELSCYVSAMGGIDFGTSIFEGTTVNVNTDGSTDVSLSLTKGSLTIYGITCSAFVDLTNGIKYYNGTEWVGATYELSEDTAADNAGNEINYVDKITFTLPYASDSYDLAFYINSDAHGFQFGGPGSKYAATLTIDWDTAKNISTPDSTTDASSDIEYEVKNGYEVSIPAKISVDSTTGVGNYEISASNFIISENGYVTVTTNKTGTLSNATNSISFTNELENKALTTTGEKLSGVITVDDSATSPGKYTGTVNFTINYYSGE